MVYILIRALYSVTFLLGHMSQLLFFEFFTSREVFALVENYALFSVYMSRLLNSDLMGLGMAFELFHNSKLQITGSNAK